MVFFSSCGWSTTSNAIILWFVVFRLRQKFLTKNELRMVLWWFVRAPVRLLCVRCVNNNELFSWICTTVDHCIVSNWFHFDLPLTVFYFTHTGQKKRYASKTNKPIEWIQTYNCDGMEKTNEHLKMFFFSSLSKIEKNWQEKQFLHNIWKGKKERENKSSRFCAR